MADTKSILNRINSVEETRKITNAMYLISTNKLRKARKSLEETRPFFHELKKEIARIVQNVPVNKSRYFVLEENPVFQEGKCGILSVTADKGLAGAYNQNVIRKTMEAAQKYPDHKLFVVGEYGKHYFASHDMKYDRRFNFADVEPSLYSARKMAGYIMEKYDKGELSQVIVIYTDMRNALASETIEMRLVPFEKSYFTEVNYDNSEFEEYEYYPSAIDFMEKSIPIYCIGVMYSVLVEAFCCEQNDRMMAMDSANQNADKLIKELRTKYNRVRQSGITQEITEISASVKAARKN